MFRTKDPIEVPQVNGDQHAGPRTPSWAAWRQTFERQASPEEAKTYIFEKWDGDHDLRFGYKMLTQQEQDLVQAAATRRIQVGRTEKVEGDAGAAMRALLRYGLTSGPEGFNPKHPEDIEALPPLVREKLAEAIDSYASMDAETRQAFKSFRSGTPNPADGDMGATSGG